MKHFMRLKKEPFQKMWNGSKTIELRLMDEKRQLLKNGDRIEFQNLADKNQTILTQVTALHVFKNFGELYATLPLEKCGYGKRELAEAKPEDMLAFYSAEEQELYGVVGIEIEVLERYDQELTRTSKYISMILRHKPQAAGVTLDRNGWAKVDELIAGVSKKYPLSLALLEEIVRKDEKQRYSFNEDKTMIRANQGHSVNVDVQLEELSPPDILWHGTGDKFAESIEKNGLIAKTRLYVHLSADFDTAMTVGARHGNPVIYRVDTKQMYADGFRFYRSANDVWLTKYVPCNYLERCRR